MRTSIRIIVDAGKVDCPLCHAHIRAGWGHRCTVDTIAKTSQGVDFRLPVEVGF